MRVLSTETPSQLICVPYPKRRMFFTVVGFIFSVVDIGTDIFLSVRYFHETQYLWSGMTMLFVLLGMLATQIFSWAWYRDDSGEANIPKAGLAVLHILGLGTFFRYYHILKQTARAIWGNTESQTAEDVRKEHSGLFCMATDLSMLKMFEAFMESVPQLLLQLYIIQSHHEWSILQLLSLAFSFFNVAWSLVDYRYCLRRSLPHYKEMPSGLPTAVYLVYKLCTITSLVLSYSLLLTRSIYSTVALTFLWLLLTVWVHLLKTHFCTSRRLELLYRAIIGVILVFTFFNVKGRNTKTAMIIFYICHGAINTMAPILFYVFKPDLHKSLFLPTICVIGGGAVLGMALLILYYRYLHPRGGQRQADEVDGLHVEANATLRLRRFLQP